jgi:hypothetical protein
MISTTFGDRPPATNTQVADDVDLWIRLVRNRLEQIAAFPE